MEKRVVITGMGTVNAIGHNVPEFWNSLQQGKSGVGPITRFDASDYPNKIAAEIKDFKPSDYIEKREARKMEHFSHIALVSSMEAMKQSGLSVGENIDPSRIGCIIGNGIGGLRTLEDGFERIFKRDTYRVPPMTIPMDIANIGPGNISIHFGIWGPTYTITTACASGTDAIGNAARLIKDGTCDAIITGGTEAAVTKMGIAGFCVIQAVSTRFNDTPEKASRPFDKDRDGFVMGEGAGILIIEGLEHAKKRGANILAEVGGYGQTCDAYHLTAPHAEGRGAADAMKMAIEQAGLTPGDVDYINAHGTSTPVNDPIETLAVKKSFGEHAYKVKISSTKSMTGHCIGGGGGLEAIACIKAIQDGVFPPTINLDEPDEKCDLDYVPNKAQKGTIRAAISNSLGFGGHNGVLLFKKYAE